MKRKIFDSFDEAVADIPDGATIMFGGFARPGTPRNLIAALLHQGAKNLTGVSNRPGGGRRISDEVLDVGRLIEKGRIRKMICAFTAPTRPSETVVFDRMYEAGQIEAELVPQGTLAERIRAAGAGLAAFYTPTGAGTEIAAKKECREFNGRQYVLEHALPADYSFVRAYRAGYLGQPAVQAVAKEFRANHGPSRSCDDCRGRERHRPRRIPQPR